MVGYAKAHVAEKDTWIVLQLKSFVVIDHGLTEEEADRLLEYLRGVRKTSPIETADHEKYAEIYADYPKKGGGEEGMRVLAKQKAPLSEVKSAVANYLVQTRTYEKKFIKGFPAWCRRWREYLPDHRAPETAVNGEDLFKW